MESSGSWCDIGVAENRPRVDPRIHDVDGCAGQVRATLAEGPVDTVQTSIAGRDASVQIHERALDTLEHGR